MSRFLAAAPAFALAVAGGLLCGPAHAVTQTYSLSKGYSLNVPAKGLFSVELLHAEKVWTEEALNGSLFRCNQDPNPANVPCDKGFGPNLEVVPVPGTGVSTAYSARLLPAANDATGVSAFVVRPYAAGASSVIAGLALQGSATAVAPAGTTKSTAFAQSTADVRVALTNVRTGEVSFSALAHLAAATNPNDLNRNQVGGFGQLSVVDPVSYQLRDLVTGQIRQGTLFDLTLSLSQGIGDIAWDSAASRMVFDLADPAASAELLIDIDSPYVLQHGRLHLGIGGGVVTTSETSGIFAGLLPSVGSPGSFTLPLGDISVDFDFSAATPNETDLVLDMSDTDSAFASAINPIPEPTTVSMLVCGSLALLAARRRVARSRLS